MVVRCSHLGARAHLHGAIHRSRLTLHSCHTGCDPYSSRDRRRAGAQRAQARHREGWRTTKMGLPSSKHLYSNVRAPSFKLAYVRAFQRCCARAGVVLACSACAKSPCASPLAHIITLTRHERDCLLCRVCEERWVRARPPRALRLGWWATHHADCGPRTTRQRIKARSLPAKCAQLLPL